MSESREMASKAGALRQGFDRAFALPPLQVTEEVEDLLAIRVSGDAYAVRVRDVAGIVMGRKVVPVPTETPNFLGLAGIRSGVVAVFGLAAILGHARATDSSRWMILCGADEPVALVFSELEGYLRVPRSALHTDERLRSARQYVEAVASTETGLRAVIGLPLIVETIRNRIGEGRFSKGK